MSLACIPRFDSISVCLLRLPCQLVRQTNRPPDRLQVRAAADSLIPAQLVLHSRLTSPQILILRTPPPLSLFPISLRLPSVIQHRPSHHHCSPKKQSPGTLFLSLQVRETRCQLARRRIRSLESVISCGGVLGISFHAVSANSISFPIFPTSTSRYLHRTKRINLHRRLEL